MQIWRRPDHTVWQFFRRTIAAQIHLLGCLTAVLGLAWLLYQAPLLRTHPLHLWACLGFGVTALMVFSVSSLYHFLHDGFTISPETAALFEKLDHFSIYLFIAGTYTPVLLNLVQPPWRLIMIGLVWGFAIFGILFTQFQSRLPRFFQGRLFSTSLFVIMGWLLLARGQEIVHGLSPQALGYLALGAVSYTIGAFVYAFKWPNLVRGLFGFHELWHAFVLIGFSFHFLLILSFYRNF